jgi:hypothetical protein
MDSSSQLGKFGAWAARGDLEIARERSTGLSRDGVEEALSWNAPEVRCSPSVVVCLPFCLS